MEKNKFPPTLFPYLAIFLIPILYFDNQVSTEYFWSKAFWLNILAYGGIVYWISLTFFKNRPLKFYIGRSTIPVVLFAILAVLSLTWSYNYYKGAELILKVGGSVAVYFLIVNLFDRREQTITMIEIAFVATFIVIFYGLLQYSQILYLPRDQYGESDPSSTIGLTNFVIEYVIVILPAYLGMLGITRSNLKRALIISAMIPLYYYFFIAKNRAGLVAASMEIFFGFFLIVIYLLIKRKKLPFSAKTILIFLVALVLGAYLILFQTDSGRKIRKKFYTVFHLKSSIHKDDSIRFRLETWKQAPRILKDHPFGLGLANLEIYFPLYYSPYLITMTLHNNTRVVRSHNDYIQTLVDLGIEGFLLLAWIIIAIISLMWTLLKKIDAWDDFWLFWSISTGLAGFLTIMFFTFPLQEPTSSLYFWSFLGLLEVLKKSYTPETSRKYITVKWNGVKAGLAIFGSIVFLVTVTLSFRGFKAEVFYKEARLLKSIKKWDYSKILLDDAIRNNPTMEGFYYDRAVSLMKMGYMDKALQDLEKTASMVPYYGIGRQQLGYMYYQMGNCKKALPHLLTAYRIYYTHPLKYATYILSCYIKQRNYKKAVEFGEDAYAKARKKLKTLQARAIHSPKYKRYLTNWLKKYGEFLEALGDAYMLAGNYGKAAEMYREAYKYTGSPQAITNLGLALIRTGDYSKAVSTLEEAISINPGSAKAWFNLGEVKFRLGKKEEALKDFKKAFDLDPSLKFKARTSPIYREFPELQELLKK